MNEYWNEKLKLLTPMFHNNEVNGGEDTESIILELQQIAKDQREACERETKLEVAKPGPCRDIPQRQDRGETMNKKYFEKKFDELRLVWDTKHYIKLETIAIFQTIAADQREACVRNVEELGMFLATGEICEAVRTTEIEK